MSGFVPVNETMGRTATTQTIYVYIPEFMTKPPIDTYIQRDNEKMG